MTTASFQVVPSTYTAYTRLQGWVDAPTDGFPLQEAQSLLALCKGEKEGRCTPESLLKLADWLTLHDGRGMLRLPCLPDSTEWKQVEAAWNQAKQHTAHLSVRSDFWFGPFMADMAAEQVRVLPNAATQVLELCAA
jgi:hypothetical protein